MRANAPESEEIPARYLCRPPRNFCGKKNKNELWRAVNKSCPGILAWVLGDKGGLKK